MTPAPIEAGARPAPTQPPARADDAVTTRMVQGDGVALAVTERGPLGAPVIVLVHGYPDSQRVWDRVAALLAARHRVVTYDVRGAGRSGAPRGTRAYALEHLARDLEAVIDAVAPRGPDARVHVAGHDWGSIQAWEAVTEPRIAARIKSYTSISGPCLDHVGAWLRGDARGVDAVRQAVLSWYIYVMHAASLAPGAWGAVLARTMSRAAVKEQIPRDPEREATLASDAANGVGMYVANIFPRVLAPRERRTDVPVQVVAPLGDPFVSPALTRNVHRFARTVFRREVVGGAHWQQLSHPERTARWIAELVTKVEGGDVDPSFDRLEVSSSGARRELVVVTGGASGIGRETCFTFAKEGADVVVADRDPSGAERTAELCRLLQPRGRARARAREVDVASEPSMRALAEAILREDGVPDVLVLNAGIGLAGSILDTSAKDWERLLGVNVMGVANGARLLGKAMVERGQGGHVVVTSSAAAFSPSKVLPAYSASKAAALMIAECLRAELAASGVGVSAICPGLIDTPITRRTEFVGVTASASAAQQARAEKLYRRRGVGPHVVAEAIRQAVRDDLPVVPVAAEAHLLRALSRFAPGLLRHLARNLEVPR